MNEILSKYKKHIFALGLFFAAYFPTYNWMWDRWWAQDSYYSHGFLIPIVSIYLIWQLKDELKLIKWKESPWGMRLILLGMGIHIVSSLPNIRIYFSSGYSTLIVLVGFILFFFGSKTLKKIAFPIFFLAFMIPLPQHLIVNISFKLKMFAAEIAAILLNNMGIPALQKGSLIIMRNTQVIVDDVCSGLRSLISLTALGSIFAYWMQGSHVKRVILFLSTIPIAIVTNVCRVVMLSCVSEIWGAQYATGFWHDLTGYMIFVLAFILLFAVKKLLE